MVQKLHIPPCIIPPSQCNEVREKILLKSYISDHVTHYFSQCMALVLLLALLTNWTRCLGGVTIHKHTMNPRKAHTYTRARKRTLDAGCLCACEHGCSLQCALHLPDRPARQVAAHNVIATWDSGGGDGNRDSGSGSGRAGAGAKCRGVAPRKGDHQTN